MKRWSVLIVVLVVIFILFFVGYSVVYARILNFIEKHNPLSSQMARSIMKYKGFFPAELVTTLIYGESGFDPYYIGNDLEKGLGQLTPIALDEIEDYYGIRVDRNRIFEIDYNIYLTCLFLKRCKVAARAKAEQEGLYLYYATLLTYKDWLAWSSWTYTKADRTWEVYNQLKWGYQKYGREVGDVRYAFNVSF